MPEISDTKKLYLISQEVNYGFDTYDSAVVCAEDVKEAKNTHPRGGSNCKDTSDWCLPKYVHVKFIGYAEKRTKKGVIVASLNAG